MIGPFRVIVAGGRDFDDYPLLCEKLDHLLANKARECGVIIVSGACKTGADKLGERYAQERGFGLERYPAEWELHGDRAEASRNQFVVNIGQALVVFWSDGETEDMIRRAKAKGIPVRVIRY